MSRKRNQLVEVYGDNAVTWFFVGLLIIALIAAFLGHVDMSA
jgi:hypothetical protein